MTWIEVHLDAGCEPRELYEWLGEHGMHVASVHHFWDEPWNPGAFVVRLKDLDGDWREVEGCAFVAGVYSWDSAPDETLYGAGWPYVQEFFKAGSILGTGDPAPDHFWHVKLVHCYLNAQGMGEYQEARWAWRFMWNRLTIRPRIRWRNLRLRASSRLSRSVIA